MLSFCVTYVTFFTIRKRHACSSIHVFFACLLIVYVFFEVEQLRTTSIPEGLERAMLGPQLEPTSAVNNPKQ